MSHQSASSLRRRALAVAAVSLALVAAGIAGPAWAQLSRSMARTIGVAVVDGRIVVTEPTATISASSSVVMWRLQTPGYVFADNGVALAGGQDAYACERSSDSLSVRCSRLKAASGQRFSYSINLVDQQTSGAAQLPQPYVWIVND